jgi:hypothetical protein
MIDKRSSSILLCAAIALSASSASVLAGQVPPGRAEFTVNMTVVYTSVKTGKSTTTNRSYAQRSDGSSREDVADYQTTRGQGVLRSVYLALPSEKIFQHGHPYVQSVSTISMTDAEAQQYGILPRFDEKCSTKKGLEGAAFAGFSNVAGQRVAVYTLSQWRRNTEFSFAPDLECYPLRMTVDAMDEKGAVVHRYKSEAYGVDLGAPDSGLFADPFAGFVERPPSEIIRLMSLKIFHRSTSSDDTLESRRRLDDFYYRRMPRGGITKDPPGSEK